jgi:hypothetical protein
MTLLQVFLLIIWPTISIIFYLFHITNQNKNTLLDVVACILLFPGFMFWIIINTLESIVIWRKR